MSRRAASLIGLIKQRDRRVVGVVGALVVVVVALVVVLTSSASTKSGDSNGSAIVSPVASQTVPAAKPHRPRLIHSARRANSLSLAKMVGQMIMPGMAGTSPSRHLLAEVRRGEIGGIILYSYNIGPGLRSALAALQRAARAGRNPPLLVSVDQEGGPIRRFPGAPPTIGPREMSSAALAFQQGGASGNYLAARGVNLDLAPVSDVAGTSGFEVAQDRGFAGGPQRVARMASAFSRGLQSARVAATAKHFPGVGALTTDTDFKLASIDSSLAELRHGALVPFQSAIGAGVDLVMVANAIYPALDRSRAPGGFSYRIVTQLLKGQLHFRGVVITDALDSPAALGGTFGSRAVRAARAGADITLFAPDDAGVPAYSALLQAARSGVLTRSRIQDAYERVLALKRQVAK